MDTYWSVALEFNRGENIDLKEALDDFTHNLDVLLFVVDKNLQTGTLIQSVLASSPEEAATVVQEEFYDNWPSLSGAVCLVDEVLEVEFE